MAYSYLLALCFIQGVAEFLPISSSAHLVLLPALSGMADQGDFIDVAAHFGSLLAVLVFYRRRVAEVLRLRDMELGYKIGLSFLPILLVGIFVMISGARPPRAVSIVAWNSVIFGILLWLADRRAGVDGKVSYLNSLLAGIGQALAVIPGVSRSGIILTSLRAQGISRAAAVEFAFLMSIPAIAAATGEAMLSAHKSGLVVNWAETGFVVATSFLFSLVAIKFMTAWVARRSMAVFAGYRVALGVALLVWFV
ncbi:MAG: undecaprenyl-diphosphate phosphatase [Alphaproteobacteria bacterium]|nr:undecaprenyl-diphosphate phosphatase [Alphaproteobacteria bacterium]